MQILVRINKISKPAEYILNINMLFYPVESINIFRQKLDSIGQNLNDSLENFKTVNLKSMSLLIQGKYCLIT